MRGSAAVTPSLGAMKTRELVSGNVAPDRRGQLQVEVLAGLVGRVVDQIDGDDLDHLAWREGQRLGVDAA
jgi:hypothetical protein